MMKRKRSITKIHKELISKKILGLLLDDFSLFGSIPFYIFITLAAIFLNDLTLASRLAYCFLIGFIIVIIVKKVHFKDRPQKEEFNIFMEKVIASSFPSTHSMSIAIISILIALSYPYAGVIITLIIMSLLVFMQRYITKKHFVVDIIGGILISIAITIFVIKVL